jgi:hypothetical protein
MTMGNDRADQRKSFFLVKQDRDVQLHTLVSNFKKLSMATHLESLLSFFEGIA